MTTFNLNQSKSLQFELWQECNNKCDFCYLGEDNKFTSKERKLQSINDAYAKICDMSNYPEFNVIGYIGGEFFQGQLADKEVRDAFFQLLRKTADLYNNGIIRQVWLSATLNIGHQEDLYEILEMFNDKSGVWIITSWDTIGRFKSDKMLATWEYHMKKLKQLYPQLRINITTILTDDVITKYLDGRLSFRDMMDEYGASFFFKQCGAVGGSVNEFDINAIRQSKIDSNKILPNFFPTRSKFLKFLRKFKQQESEEMWTRLFNIKYRADELYRNFNDGETRTTHRSKDSKKEVDDSEAAPCGHPVVYMAYVDSDACVLCDKQKIELCCE